MKKLFVFTICNFIVLSLIVSCKQGDAESDKEKDILRDSSDAEPFDGGWLIYHLSAEPATLNPITATDVYESVINGGNIYETLVKRDDATLDIVPLLAESWKISEDKLTYTFYIRKGIKWQDGVPFTSNDGKVR